VEALGIGEMWKSATPYEATARWLV